MVLLLPPCGGLDTATCSILLCQGALRPLGLPLPPVYGRSSQIATGRWPIIYTAVLLRCKAIYIPRLRRWCFGDIQIEFACASLPHKLVSCGLHLVCISIPRRFRRGFMCSLIIVDSSTGLLLAYQETRLRLYPASFQARLHANKQTLLF
jgi:hypothetical protein